MIALKRIRRQALLSQEELGAAIGYSGASICRVERRVPGERRRILWALSKYFGVPIEDLLAEEQEVS